MVHDRPVSSVAGSTEGDETEAGASRCSGSSSAEKLFGSRDPLGKQIRVGDTSFRVVGVEARLGNRRPTTAAGARREMNGVLIPLVDVPRLPAGRRAGQPADRQDRNKRQPRDVKAEVERLVRRAHHGVGDFEIENVADEMLKAEKEMPRCSSTGRSCSR